MNKIFNADGIDLSGTSMKSSKEVIVALIQHLEAVNMLMDDLLERAVR